MINTILVDDRETVELLRSMKHLMTWLHSIPRKTRQRVLAAIAECSDESQDVVFRMVSVVESRQSTRLERQRALATIADTLFLNPEDEGESGQDLAASEAITAAAHPSLGRELQRMDSQETTFADQLRRLMAEKRVTQQELASRTGCSQPAVSQMLNRKCRPQKKTILKVAEALRVDPRELWPDLEIADMLDAVASFEQDDYVMTDAEAKALRDTARRNTPTIPSRRLPTRRR